MLLRTATIDDTPVLAEMALATANYLRAVDQSPYSSGLAKTITQAQSWASKFIETDTSLALLAEVDEEIIGCILAEIAITTMPSSGLEKVGHIQLCWIEENYRQQNCALLLSQQVESWFASKNITHIELSYMVGNVIAGEVWRRLGYKPFRTFSYKIIG